MEHEEDIEHASSIDIDEPKRDMAYRERLEPNLAKVRHERPLPIMAKFATESIEPRRVIP
jgi:hypothetical protein